MRPLTIQTYEAAADYAEVIQANLTEIGITSEIEIAEINAFISDAFAGNVDLFVLDVGLGSNPASWMSMFTTGGQMNFAHYSNTRVDELYAEAVANPDRDQRQELYSEIFRIVIDEDAAMIPILGGCSCHVFSNELEIGDALETCYSTALPYDLSFR